MAFQEYFLYTRHQKNSDRKFFGENFVVVIYITVTLMAVSLVDGFSCGSSCTCNMITSFFNDTMEYEVVCSLPEGKANMQEFVLTEDIFSSPPSNILQWISSIKIFGNSENTGRVLVRESFLRAWRGFNISLLELKNLSNLSFERHTQTSFGVSRFLGSADVTISGCNIDLLPGRFFLGKDYAGLSIVNSTVAVIDQGLLRSVYVNHFHIKASSIGILRGPMSPYAVFVYGPPDDSVIIENSSIALLEKDSFWFIGDDPSQNLSMKFNWVRVGTIEQEAITLEGFAFVQFENNIIMDFHREGLSIQTRKVHLHSNTMVIPEDEISNSSYCGQGTTVRNNVIMVSDALPPSSPEALREVASESSCLSNSIFISHESLLHPKIPKQFLTEVSLFVFFLFALCTFLLTLIIAWVVCHCYYSKKSRSSREISIHRMRLLHHDDSMMNTFTRFQEPDLTIDITEEQQENMTTIEPETLPHPHDQKTQREMTTNSSFSKDLNNAELKDSVDLTRKPSEEIQEPSDEKSKKKNSETSSIGGISSKTNEDSFQKHLDASSAKENSSEKTNEDVKLEHRENPSVEENAFEMTDEVPSDLDAEYKVDDNPLH